MVGVPLPGGMQAGLDYLLSTVQMPKGVPVATMTVGKAGAINAAIFCAEMFSVHDEEISKKLTAFKELTEQDGTLLRLWEQAGQAGSCTITLPEGSVFKKAYPCNLRNEIYAEEAITISDRSFEIEIQANQPLSFILR